MKTAVNIANEMARRPLKNWPDTDKVESGRILLDKLWGLSSNMRSRIAELLDGDERLIPIPTELCSQTRAAKVLGVSTKTIKRMIADGRLKATTIGDKPPKILGKTILDILYQKQSH